jgi:hypothetical protein
MKGTPSSPQGGMGLLLRGKRQLYTCNVLAVNSSQS